MRKIFTLLFVMAALCLSIPAHAFKVYLSWEEGVGNDPTVAYNVYRSIDGGVTFQLLSSEVITTAYTDPAITLGKTYVYYVTALDAEGAESVPSNTTTVTIPSLQLNPATNPQGTLVADTPPGYYIYPLVYPTLDGGL